MPIREAPVDVKEPTGEPETGFEAAEAEEIPARESDGRTNSAADDSDDQPRAVRSSRWVDYDTHELLELIGELEDERRWARLREGVLWAVLLHILLLLAIIFLPKYVLKMTPAIETDNLKNHKDFTYLDSPFVPQAKPVRPLARPPQIDSKTLQDLKREAPPTQAAPPPPPPQQQTPEQAKPEPTQPIPPNPQSQSQIEAPRPAAVPARPSFAMDNGNPADQLKRDMQNAMRSHGGSESGQVPLSGLPGHPGAGGGAQILSDTQGVDFNAWLAAWYYETKRTWDPLIPEEVNPPISKQGQVMIRFKVLPNGRLMDGSLVLEGRSGDVALDRAAWGALTGSSYPPLPRDFHGPYIELRAWFLYNMEPPQQ
jgi:outer membrane biosynthesis protein TonB